MEDVNKSLDIDKMFNDVENAFGKYESEQKDGNYLMNMVINALNGLIYILKKTYPKMPDSKIINRTSQFVDKIHKSREDGSLWSLSTCVKDGEALIYFLGELGRVGIMSQVDKIFRYGKGHYPLVNELSTYRAKDKFFEMFHTLPKEYQDKLLSENISWEEGDKMYGCPLIGGTALMGF